jgi:hypothetical protein
MKLRHLLYTTLLLLLLPVFAQAQSTASFHPLVSDALDTAQNPLNASWDQCPSHDTLYVPNGSTWVITHTNTSNGCSMWATGFVDTSMYVTFKLHQFACKSAESVVMYIRAQAISGWPGSAYRLTIKQDGKFVCGYTYTLDETDVNGVVKYTFATGATLSNPLTSGGVTFGFFGNNYTNSTLFIYQGTTEVAAFSTAPAGANNFIAGDHAGFQIKAAGTVNALGINSFVGGYVTIP